MAVVVTRGLACVHQALSSIIKSACIRRLYPCFISIIPGVFTFIILVFNKHVTVVVVFESCWRIFLAYQYILSILPRHCEGITNLHDFQSTVIVRIHVCKLDLSAVILFCTHAAVCSQGCYNGGICVRPTVCRCRIGWTGSNCKTRKFKYIVLSVVESGFMKRDFYCAQEIAFLAQSEGLTTTKKDHQPLCYFLSTLAFLHIALF